MSKMDVFTLEHLRDAVELSSMCMGIFDDKTGRVTCPNQALRESVKLKEFSVKVTSQSDDRMYGRLEQQDLPVSLRVLSGRSPAYLVEVYLAHSKDSSRSDVIQLVEMTSDGVWEWFPSLQYEFMSERFWSILGYDHKVMPSSPDAWSSIIDPTDLARALECFDAHVATRGDVPYNLNVSYTHKKGHEVQVKCRGAVVEWLPDGTPWRLLGTHTDITEITEAVDAKARFVSRMSHEIRTPICAILHECEVLEEHGGTAVIADSCDQLLSLCNDILTVEKLCRPKAMEVERRSVNAEEFLHKAVRRHAGQASKKGVGLRGRVHKVPHTSLMVDVSKCNQVVDNLVSNAIKYTESPGFVCVELQCCTKVRPIPPTSPSTPRSSENGFMLEDGGEESSSEELMLIGDGMEEWWDVEVAVRDTGLGIHPEDRSVVFDKFRQANSSMQGAGLGLSISKELARLLTGDVILSQSEIGKGSTFVFSFPAPAAPSTAAPKVVAAAAVAAVVAGANDKPKSIIRILSADDMLTNRKIMRRRLQAIEEQLGAGGIEVVDAVDGRDAVRVFRDVGNFDVVFMDCLMPEMNGFEAAIAIHHLCDEKGIPRVPVVAVTASVSNGLHQECREAGMSQVVTKPFDAIDLMAVFAAAIDAEGRRAVPSPSTHRPRPPPPVMDRPPTLPPLPPCRPHDMKHHGSNGSVVEVGPE